MAKTLVVAKHEPGPAQNGHDGCCARWANDGMCPGVKNAEWLNALGDDNDLYIRGNEKVPGSHDVTCGQVRTNWIRGNTHVVPMQPRQAALVAEISRLSAELRRAKRELRRVEAQS